MYEIIDKPENSELKDLITWEPINSSKVLKISHGESTSYLSIESLYLMNKTNKLINPITNTDFPSNINKEILEAIELYSNDLILDQLNDLIKKMTQEYNFLDYSLENNRPNNYEKFIIFKFEILNILKKIKNGKKEKITYIVDTQVSQLYTQLLDIENKILKYRENLFYNIMLLDLCFSRGLNIEIPYVTDFTIPEYILNYSKQYKITSLDISVSNVKNYIKGEHFVNVQNLDQIISLVSRNYIDWPKLLLKNIKYYGIIDLTELYNGFFRFHLYCLEQNMIFPNKVKYVELISYVSNYVLDLQYINYIDSIEIKGDYDIISMPKKINKLVWILPDIDINNGRKFIQMLNEKQINFNQIILKSKNYTILNSMLENLNPVFYNSTTNCFVCENFNTREISYMYNTHINKNLIFSLGFF